MLKTHKLTNGELFCWVMKDWTGSTFTVYIDHVGNFDGGVKPSIRYSAKGLRDLYPGCKYYVRLGKPEAYDISELTTEELQQFFEKEAL